MGEMPNESRELRAFAPALILLAICALINYVGSPQSLDCWPVGSMNLLDWRIS
jgi:hypothetical protein